MQERVGRVRRPQKIAWNWATIMLDRYRHPTDWHRASLQWGSTLLAMVLKKRAQYYSRACVICQGMSKKFDEPGNSKTGKMEPAGLLVHWRGFLEPKSEAFGFRGSSRICLWRRRMEELRARAMGQESQKKKNRPCSYSLIKVGRKGGTVRLAMERQRLGRGFVCCCT